MLKSYIQIAWRNLWKDKTFTTINIVGLSVAFLVAILVSMAGFFELSFENPHHNKDSVFQVYTINQTANGPVAGTSKSTPFAEALQQEVPGVAKKTRIYEDSGTIVLSGDKEIMLDAIWVDADFFSMFTFPLFKGEKGKELADLSSVVLTEDAAQKLFGRTDVLNEVITILIDGVEKPFSIGAITRNPPRNTSMGFEMAIRFENNPEYAQTLTRWNAQYHEVYVQLDPNIKVAEFEKNTHSFTNLHYEEVIENNKRDGAVASSNGSFMEIKLLPLKDIRFTSFKQGYARVDRSMPYLLLGVALLILFIACVNFINMSIAKSVHRLKEIGVRKTLGAKVKQLFFQFWGESLLIFLSASGIGILLSILLLDNFKSLFRTQMTLEVLTNPIIISGFTVAVLLITLVVGGYPALLWSRLGAIQSLKGKLEINGKNRLRNGLIILQFSIAILLITGTLVLQEQINFMRNKDLGFEKEQIISFPLNGKKDSYVVLNLLKQELAGNPDILSVSAADNNLGRGRDGSRYSSAVGFDHKGKTIITNFLVVDYEYVETLDLKMVLGRSFNKPGDSLGVLINETMARQLEEEELLSVSLDIERDIPSPILGVVKDYNFEGLDKAIGPITFYMSQDLALRYAYVKVAPTNMANTFETVAAAWRKLEPNAEFMGSFLDENIDRTFRREKSMAGLITAGSIIAIVLSCIGLFAMSTLIVLQRTKEIGIRKVIGASVTSITYILTKDFLKLVLIAFLIASPIAWWFLKEWLKNYAYKIELSWWFFAASGILAIIIAFATVGTRTIKAARTNPVKSLRTE